MDWREHIEATPGIMGGKPVIRGTRVTVEILLDWFAAGWSESEILRNYPRVTVENLHTVHAFSREFVGEQFYNLTARAA